MNDVVTHFLNLYLKYNALMFVYNFLNILISLFQYINYKFTVFYIQKLGKTKFIITNGIYKDLGNENLF